MTVVKLKTGRKDDHLTKDNARPESGDHRRGETHVPIPNTLVKPSAANGSAATLLCESRSSPVYMKPV